MTKPPKRRTPKALRAKTPPKPRPLQAAASAPNWKGRCEVCGASPTHPETGMCGPCTFGDASTLGGNW